MTTPGSDPRYDALAALALGTLPEAERPDLATWLAGDAAAQSQLRALREAVALLTVVVPIVEPPLSLRERVLAIAGESGAPRPSASRSVTAAPRPASTGSANTSWGTTGWWLAAASTLLAIGLGIYAARLRGEVAQLSASLDTTAARLATAEAEARDNRTRLLRAQSETSILTAPDLRRVDLAGQPTAPGAIARAFWSRAQGLVLTASRLPDLPRGRTYQLWVLTSGAPVSAGIFKGDAAGGATAVFDTPVSLPAPQGLAVSIEPDGGVPAPTGAIILVGKTTE